MSVLRTQILAEAGQAVGIDPRWLTHETRVREIAHKRQDAMLWLFEERGWCFSRIGAAMGRDHTTVAYGIARARERRVGE